MFGKTGTGKSFLTRMLLAGVINAELASVLVFDMHNEYGMWSEDEETKRKAPALKEMFGQKVLIFSVDPESSRRRSVTPDYEVQIAVSDIEVDDLVLLRSELNLSDAQIRDMDTLSERWGDALAVPRSCAPGRRHARRGARDAARRAPAVGEGARAQPEEGDAASVREGDRSPTTRPTACSMRCSRGVTS